MVIARLFMVSVVFLLAGLPAKAEGPLPEFTYKGVTLKPEQLTWAPNVDLEQPSAVKVEGHVKNPLGRYYLYYAPHKHIGIGMAYSDSLAGPWTEYKGNPVLEGPASPDVRWIEANGKFYLWGHRKNSQTEQWSSKDGIHFEYQGVSVAASNIGTRNASYSRVYDYPLKQLGSKYVMLYSGFIEEREIQCVWLAYSKDAVNWTQLKTPLVEPIEGEGDTLYSPSLLRHDGRNYIVYQDHTGWRGGNVKYVKVGKDLAPVGNKGKRFLLLDPPPELAERYRGGEFYREGATLYMISGASKNPRIYVYATAEAKAGEPEGPRASPASTGSAMPGSKE